MTNYQIGDLLLVDFPFTATGPGKPRPALVLLDAGDADVLLSRVTTQSHGSPYDVPICDKPSAEAWWASSMKRAWPERQESGDRRRGQPVLPED